MQIKSFTYTGILLGVLETTGDLHDELIAKLNDKLKKRYPERLERDGAYYGLDREARRGFYIDSDSVLIYDNHVENHHKNVQAMLHTFRKLSKYLHLHFTKATIDLEAEFELEVESKEQLLAIMNHNLLPKGFDSIDYESNAVEAVSTTRFVSQTIAYELKLYPSVVQTDDIHVTAHKCKAELSAVVEYTSSQDIELRFAISPPFFKDLVQKIVNKWQVMD